MRKIMSLVLALALVMSLSITAFATDTTGVSTGSYNTDVTGTYVEGTTASGTVFSVDIAWNGMSFTYHAEKAPVWDSDSHTYSESTPAYWEGEGTITVTNHSNAKITATPAYTKETAYSDVEITFSTEQLSVGSAAVSNAAVSGTITVTPGGTLASTANNTKIGTITVTIAQDTNVTAEEVTALYDAAKARQSVWTEAGYGDDAQILINNLEALESAVVSGNFDSQEQINQVYAEYLAEYNALEAKVNG